MSKQETLTQKPRTIAQGFYALSAIKVIENVRTEFGGAQDKELVADIKAHGILQPVVIRLDNDKVKGPFILVAGERRYRAAKEAGLKEIPAILIEASAELARDLQMIENLQRKDLNPIEEAEGFAALAGIEKVERYAMHKTLPTADYLGRIKQVASKVGKSQAYVIKAMRLLELPEALKTLIAKGSLSPAHGHLVLTTPPDMWEELTKWMKDRLNGAYTMNSFGEAPTLDDLERTITQRCDRDLGKALFPTDKPYAGEVACSLCPWNTSCEGTLIPELTEKGDKGKCRQGKCFAKKTDQVWRDARAAFEKKDETLKDLRFLGFAAQAQRWQDPNKIPDMIKGARVLGTTLPADYKNAFKDALTRQAFGWAIVKGKPARMVYVLVKPELLKDDKKAVKAMEKASAEPVQRNGYDPKQSFIDNYVREASNAAVDAAVKTLSLTKVKALIMNLLDDCYGIRNAVEAVGLKDKKTFNEDDLARVLLAFIVKDAYNVQLQDFGIDQKKLVALACVQGVELYEKQQTEKAAQKNSDVAEVKASQDELDEERAGEDENAELEEAVA
jgi:ParB/RepB/Spo0J family partition protein